MSFGGDCVPRPTLMQRAYPLYVGDGWQKHSAPHGYDRRREDEQKLIICRHEATYQKRNCF